MMTLIFRINEEKSLELLGRSEKNFREYIDKTSDNAGMDKVGEDEYIVNICIRHVYYSAFSENGKTFFIISWLKVFNNLFQSHYQRLLSLTYQERKTYTRLLLTR